MRTLLCLEQLNSVRDVPGDVLELGVAYGTTALTLALWMEENTPSKQLFACDTFEGLPVAEGDLEAGECDYGRSFERALRSLPISNVTPIKGLIEITLPERLADQQFCFAWMDLDLYAPTSFAARFLADRISPGGVIGFHDYGFERTPGIKQVVDHEIDRDKFDLFQASWNCAFLRRRL